MNLDNLNITERHILAGIATWAENRTGLDFLDDVQIDSIGDIAQESYAKHSDKDIKPHQVAAIQDFRQFLEAIQRGTAPMEDPAEKAVAIAKLHAARLTTEDL